MKIQEFTIILICLNDEDRIEGMISSLGNLSNTELIVVDGGSSDQSVHIAKKYTDKVFISKKGMLNQTLFGVNQATGKYIFLAEADHLYDENLLDNLKEELLKNNYNGVQASMDYIYNSNFWEKGHLEFYKIHFLKLGERRFISGPQLWKKESIHDILTNIEVEAQGYSFDTQRAEIINKLGMKVGVSRFKVYESNRLNKIKFINRFRNYGHGDFEFYKNNSYNWSLKRKLKSLTHVFFRYGISYPYNSIFHGNPSIGLPYFWLIMIVRYFYWLKRYLYESFKS
jgi:glycosyltransferase involved in cell wall biosynthesis